MTIEELLGMRSEAENQVGRGVIVVIDSDGITVRTTHLKYEDLHDATLTQAVEKLREWATPPKPATVTIEVPFEWATGRAMHGVCCTRELVDVVDSACRKAIAPYMVPSN